MEILLEGRCEMRYHTDLRVVFRAIDNRQRDFNWLISDVERSWLEARDGRPEPLTGRGPYWLTGTELTKLVADYDMQFIWAVLSGFPPDMPPTLAQQRPVPYADDNTGFWVAHPTIQHPLAELEIVCWDGSCTLLLCRDESIGEQFRRYFSQAVDLAEYNRARIANRGG